MANILISTKMIYCNCYSYFNLETALGLSSTSMKTTMTTTTKYTSKLLILYKMWILLAASTQLCQLSPIQRHIPEQEVMWLHQTFPQSHTSDRRTQWDTVLLHKEIATIFPSHQLQLPRQLLLVRMPGSWKGKLFQLQFVQIYNYYTTSL